MMTSKEINAKVFSEQYDRALNRCYMWMKDEKYIPMLGLTGGLFLNTHLDLSVEKILSDNPVKNPDIDLYMVLRPSANLKFMLSHIFHKLDTYFPTHSEFTCYALTEEAYNKVMPALESIQVTYPNYDFLIETTGDYMNKYVDMPDIDFLIQFKYGSVNIDILVNLVSTSKELSTLLKPIANFPCTPTRKFLGIYNESYFVHTDLKQTYGKYIYATAHEYPDVFYLKSSSLDYQQRCARKYTLANTKTLSIDTRNKEHIPSATFKVDNWCVDDVETEG